MGGEIERKGEERGNQGRRGETGTSRDPPGTLARPSITSKTPETPERRKSESEV